MVRPGAKLGDLWNNLTGRKKSQLECSNCEGACACRLDDAADPSDSASLAELEGPLRVQPPPYLETFPGTDASLDPTAKKDPESIGFSASKQNVDAAMAATVRLKIVDELGHSFGTGTIIDVHKDEALVLTCGHIFRDSDGKGRILCDSFAPGARPGIKGKVISFDIRRDIGLVSFRPGVPVKPVAVGGTTQRPRERDFVFAIGCNRGDDPTVIENKIIAVNRYHGPPNLVVGGRPIDGRSGGGLFNESGALIGVCNAADPEYDEGLYAALGNVHAELDSVGLGFIYRQTQPSIALVNATSEPAVPTFANTRSPKSRPKSPTLRRSRENALPAAPTQRVPKSFAPQSAASTIPPLVARIPSPDNPNEHTELVIERPSKDLMDQLIREANRRGPHRQTQLQTPNDYSEGWRSLAPSSLAQ